MLPQDGQQDHEDFEVTCALASSYHAACTLRLFESSCALIDAETQAYLLNLPFKHLVRWGHDEKESTIRLELFRGVPFKMWVPKCSDEAALSSGCKRLRKVLSKLKGNELTLKTASPPELVSNGLMHRCKALRKAEVASSELTSPDAHCEASSIPNVEATCAGRVHGSFGIAPVAAAPSMAAASVTSVDSPVLASSVPEAASSTPATEGTGGSINSGPQAARAPASESMLRSEAPSRPSQVSVELLAKDRGRGKARSFAGTWISAGCGGGSGAGAACVALSCVWPRSVRRFTHAACGLGICCAGGNGLAIACPFIDCMAHEYEYSADAGIWDRITARHCITESDNAPAVFEDPDGNCCTFKGAILSLKLIPTGMCCTTESDESA
mmetsp:Transcript_50881/g.132251  ORF Transcript_50881/g.132251 Transcript_50881/m.132251 type:complete len:384 (-) Transcript_50881:191-1342(-)